MSDLKMDTKGEAPKRDFTRYIIGVVALILVVVFWSASNFLTAVQPRRYPVLIFRIFSKRTKSPI